MPIELTKTCEAFPEQYVAKFRGQVVGNLRLRHGVFRVDCPIYGGETVYRAYPKGDGYFENNAERDFYLDIAQHEIFKWMKSNGFFSQS